MELFLILFIALIVLGPQRLPGTIREVMKYWRYFRNLSGELTSQLGEEFKDLEDLNPQRILEDLANELDEEVEATKSAAGVKKPASKTAAKKTPAKPTQTKDTKPKAVKPNGDDEATETGSDAGSEAQTEAEEGAAETKIGDTTAAATASAAAAAAVGGSAVQKEAASEAADGQDGEPGGEDAGEDVMASQDVESPSVPAQNGDNSGGSEAPTPEPSEESSGQSENTIMPPVTADAKPEPVIDQAARDGDGSDPAGAVSAEAAAEAEPSPPDEDDEDVSPSVATVDGDGDTPVTTESVGSADPAPMSVNGKGARPEDTG